MITKKITYSKDDFEFSLEPIEDTLTIRKIKSGYVARYLAQDQDYESPDAWGDNDLFLVHYHRDFTITNNKVITEDAIRVWYQTFQKDGSRSSQIDAEKEYYIFAVSAYIHSGVVLSLCHNFGYDPGGWDTSHVGAVLASKKEFPSRDKAVKAAQGLIETWNMSLSGDVYISVIEKYNKDKEQTDMDSLGGIYGYKYARKELKGMKI